MLRLGVVMPGFPCLNLARKVDLVAYISLQKGYICCAIKNVLGHPMPLLTFDK